MENNLKFYSFFAVLNNPKSNGYDYESPSRILEQIISDWTTDNLHRSIALSYCISADTKTPHIHAIFEDIKSHTFSEMKTLLPSWHLQPTKGANAEDYIYKRGSFSESGEQIICTNSYGVIKGKNAGNSLSIIREMLDRGQLHELLKIVKPGYHGINRYIAEQEKLSNVNQATIQ